MEGRGGGNDENKEYDMDVCQLFIYCCDETLRQRQLTKNSFWAEHNMSEGSSPRPS